jgi:hypothetical protein
MREEERMEEEGRSGRKGSEKKNEEEERMTEEEGRMTEEEGRMRKLNLAQTAAILARMPGALQCLNAPRGF